MDDPQLQLIPAPPTLERADGLARLAGLVGEDLRPLADEYGITVWRDGRRNKGWAGHVVERFLGQSPNASQAADFGDWELKVVPLVFTADDSLRVKESMSVTMFTADDIETMAFEESHLFEKLARLVVVARVFEGPEEARSLVAAVVPFDLGDATLRDDVKQDYEEIRWVVRNHGLQALGGQIGQWIQPRPKGAGYAAGGVGFYARARFVTRILGL